MPFITLRKDGEEIQYFVMEGKGTPTNKEMGEGTHAY